MAEQLFLHYVFGKTSCCVEGAYLFVNAFLYNLALMESRPGNKGKRKKL